MGALDYAMAGAVKGGADTWLQISGEDRQENRDIRKDARTNKYQEIRERRMAEIDQKFRTSERIAGQEFTAGENQLTREYGKDMQDDSQEGTASLQDDAQESTASLQDDSQESTTSLQDDQQEHTTSLQDSSQTHKTNERQGAEAHSIAEMLLQNDLDNQRMKLGYGEVVVDMTDPNNPHTIYQAGHKPLSTGRITNDKASKFFSTEAKAYYGQLDKSGLTAFGSDRQAKLSARASAISMKVWEQQGGEGGGRSPNEIFAKVFQHISNQKQLMDPEAALEQLEAATEDAQKFWSPESGETSDLEAKDISQKQQTYDTNRETLEESLAPPSGMLNQSSDQPPVKVNTQKEAMALPAGTRIELPDGTLGTVPRRQ